jgi:hypothetical protein
MARIHVQPLMLFVLVADRQVLVLRWIDVDGWPVCTLAKIVVANHLSREKMVSDEPMGHVLPVGVVFNELGYIKNQGSHPLLRHGALVATSWRRLSCSLRLFFLARRLIHSELLGCMLAGFLWRGAGRRGFALGQREMIAALVFEGVMMNVGPVFRFYRSHLVQVHALRFLALALFRFFLFLFCHILLALKGSARNALPWPALCVGILVVWAGLGFSLR